jgi:hypothetical protein
VRKQILSIILFLFSLGLIASPQMPDYLIFGKDTIATYNLILEQYLQKHDTSKTESLFGLAFRTGASFSCWRGYQAIYKIERDSLFLVDIINCGERRNGHINKAESIEKMKTIFRDKVLNGHVFIYWFSGYINFPLTDKVLRSDGVFYKIYENEKVISITDGNVSTIHDVENYVDDPKRIDRRDENKASNIFFKQIKKAKFKNTNEFDCSYRYLVTIDENGNVSKVRMIDPEEELDEKDECTFCINKIFNAIKTLQFDIIKDKGVPISEDIFIEIWIEDNGKLENWTHE